MGSRRPLLFDGEDLDDDFPGDEWLCLLWWWWCELDDLSVEATDLSVVLSSAFSLDLSSDLLDDACLSDPPCLSDDDPGLSDDDPGLSGGAPDITGAQSSGLTHRWPLPKMHQ